MAVDRSFTPIVGSGAKVLILGSLPGKRSITEQGYYAHPRNLFWTFLAEVTGVCPTADYQERLEGLKRVGIALWDVAAEAERPGSLDSAIKGRSVQYNEIPELLKRQDQIKTLLFNGATAETLFRRAEKVWGEQIQIKSFRLPSTSPANAGLSLEDKRRCWLDTLSAALGIEMID